MKKLVLVGLGILGGAAGACAADAGDPVFPKDLGNKARIEFVYDFLSRESDVDVGANPTREEKLEADIFLLRIHTDVEKSAFLDFDIGAMEPRGGDFGFYGGLGLRLLVLDQPSWRISAEGQGHYAPDLSGEVGGVESEFDFWNADAALLLSGKFGVQDQLRIMPYLGPMLGVQRLDGESTTGSEEDVSAEEKDILGGVAGLSLLLPGNNSIRLEGRYFGNFEGSVAAGIAF